MSEPTQTPDSTDQNSVSVSEPEEMQPAQGKDTPGEGQPSTYELERIRERLGNLHSDPAGSTKPLEVQNTWSPAVESADHPHSLKADAGSHGPASESTLSTQTPESTPSTPAPEQASQPAGLAADPPESTETAADEATRVNQLLDDVANHPASEDPAHQLNHHPGIGQGIKDTGAGDSDTIMGEQRHRTPAQATEEQREWIEEKQES